MYALYNANSLHSPIFNCRAYNSLLRSTVACFLRLYGRAEQSRDCNSSRSWKWSWGKFNKSFHLSNHKAADWNVFVSCLVSDRRNWIYCKYFCAKGKLIFSSKFSYNYVRIHTYGQFVCKCVFTYICIIGCLPSRAVYFVYLYINTWW